MGGRYTNQSLTPVCHVEPGDAVACATGRDLERRIRQIRNSMGCGSWILAIASGHIYITADTALAPRLIGCNQRFVVGVYAVRSHPLVPLFPTAELLVGDLEQHFADLGLRTLTNSPAAV